MNGARNHLGQNLQEGCRKVRLGARVLGSGNKVNELFCCMRYSHQFFLSTLSVSLCS